MILNQKSIKEEVIITSQRKRLDKDGEPYIYEIASIRRKKHKDQHTDSVSCPIQELYKYFLVYLQWMNLYSQNITQSA